jgi:uncharacterized membrane protein
VAIRNAEFLHAWRIHTHSFNTCGNNRTNPSDSRPISIINKMKPTLLVGILLIALGVVALAYQGITYTKKEKVIDFGPIQATSETQKTIPLPPLLGGICLVGGIFLVFSSQRSRS